MAGNKSKRPGRRKQRVPENKKRKQRQSKKSEMIKIKEMTTL